jgi:hypothetical protein
MGRPAGWMASLTGRSAMKSPGAPSHRREVQREFWTEIAKGLWPEDAAEAVGVSAAVGTRWFRHAGGMTPFEHPGLSGRYLSFKERGGNRAAECAERGCARYYQTSRPCAVDHFTRVAAQCCNAGWEIGLSGVGRAMEGGDGGAATEDRKASGQPSPA